MPASGTVTVSGSATLAVAAGGAGQFTNATSGSGSIGGLLAGLGGQGASVIWNAGAILGIDTTNAAGGSLTYSGSIGDRANGPLGLTKLGGGMLVLSGSNTYSGPTMVNGGTLAAAVAFALSPSSGVTVNAGLLDVTAGPQTVQSLTVGGAGGLNIYDLYPLAVSGSASFTPGSTLDITMSNSVTPGSPDLLMTYNAAQLSGSFSSVYVNGVLNGFPANDSLSYTGGSLEIVSNVVSSGGTWTGLGGTTSWAASGNWSSTTVPSSGTVVFPSWARRRPSRSRWTARSRPGPWSSPPARATRSRRAATAAR